MSDTSPKKKRKSWMAWGIGGLVLLSIPVVVIANWEAVWTYFNPAPVNSTKGNPKGIPISEIDLSKGSYRIEKAIFLDGTEIGLTGKISKIQGNMIELEQGPGGSAELHGVDRVILLKGAQGK